MFSTVADLHILFARTMTELCEMDLEVLFWRAADAGWRLVTLTREGKTHDATPGEWLAAAELGQAFGVRS